MGQTVVTVEVSTDTEREQFIVHKDVLTNCSPYFKAAFEGEFREANEKSITIPDTKPATFQTFMDWCYFGNVPVNTANSCWAKSCMYKKIGKFIRSDEDEKKHTHLSEATSPKIEDLLDEALASSSYPLLELFILADRCDVPSLRRVLTDKIYDVDAFPIYAHVIRAFTELPHNSTLCQLFIDTYASDWNLGWDETCDIETSLRARLPNAFLLAVTTALSERLKKTNAKDKEEDGEDIVHKLVNGKRHRCVYHEHSQDADTFKACQKAENNSRKRKRDNLKDI